MAYQMTFDLIHEHTALMVSLSVLVAFLVGSFLNVVIYRLPVMMEREWKEAIRQETEDESEPATDKFNLAFPASRCNQCGHQIRWYENIPVISWLALKGRCSQCKASISPRYPLIEALSAILCGVIAWKFGLTIEGMSLMVLTWSLIALTFIDVDHQLLPDSITLPLLWLGLLLNSFEIFTTLESAVWGAALGYLALWAVYWAFKLLTGKEGMGYGDFKLLAALGAWGGAISLPMIILFSSVAGVLLAGILIVTKKHQASNPLPFGPYLAIAGWFAIIFGEPIMRWYLM